jgi:hypothetical protein
LPTLATSVRAARSSEIDLPVQRTKDKRLRVRQPEELVELAEEAGSRPKGMSNYLLDLDGKKLYTSIIGQLVDNGFILKYLHPNTIFVTWGHWVPSYWHID